MTYSFPATSVAGLRDTLRDTGTIGPVPALGTVAVEPAGRALPSDARSST